MNYEQKYNELVNSVKMLKEINPSDEGIQNWVNENVPELAESEDDKIRNTIIRFFKDQYSNETEMYDGSVTVGKVIAWLEKQGEEKLPIEKLPEEMKTVGESLGFTTQEECDDYNKMVTDLIMSDDDMVEPKFHKGQWIACKELNTAFIVNVDDDKYEVEFIDGSKGFPHIDYVDRFFHLWSIEDVKDGDVLATDKGVFIYAKILYNKPYAYCGVDKFGVFKDNCLNNNWTNSIDNIHPATKEQRDLLFSKMKEAGYEWDEVKKELKKIVIHRWENGDIVRLKKDDGTRWQIARSNDPDFLDEWFICQIRESGIAGGYVSTYILDTNYEFVNNPINDSIKEIDKEFDKLRKTASETSWSEEDEYLLGETIQHLEELIRIDKAKHCGVDVQYYQRDINWLKSLKQRIGE